MMKDFYIQASQELVAKAIGELHYEEILKAEKTSLNLYEVKLQSGVMYQFHAIESIWSSLKVDPKSIVRTPAMPIICAAQFFIDSQHEMAMNDITLANFLEEMNNTLAREVIILERVEQTSASEVALMNPEQRQSYLSGHPKIILNKGRIGWSERESNLYSPESGSSFKLHWVALKKEKARALIASELSSEFLLRQSMNENEYIRFDSLISKLGVTQDLYYFLPVHPWQWDHFIRIQFAHEFVTGTLIDLGIFGDDYRPQISLRTLTNISRPAQLDIKLPLSILNTSAIRGLSEKYLEAGVQLSDFIEDIINKDEFLSKNELSVLKERAGIGYISESFHKVRGAPYRYHELLAATWRENSTYKVRANTHEQTIMTGALFFIDKNQKSLLGEFIKLSGLNPMDWLARYFRVVVVVLYHLQIKYGLGLVSHGQNIVLKLRDHIPVGIFIKDFGGDLRLSEDFSTRYKNVHFMDPLTKLPPHYLIHDLYTGHFITTLRYISAIARDYEGIAEQDFYALLGSEIEKYQQRYLLKRPDIDLLAPTFERVLINAVRFKIGYGDLSERPVPMLGSELPNPLYTALRAMRERTQ